MSDRKILILDDQEEIRDLLQDASEKKGYIIRSVGSAEEVLEILED